MEAMLTDGQDRGRRARAGRRRRLGPRSTRAAARKPRVRRRPAPAPPRPGVVTTLPSRRRRGRGLRLTRDPGAAPRAEPADEERGEGDRREHSRLETAPRPPAPTTMTTPAEAVAARRRSDGQAWPRQPPRPRPRHGARSRERISATSPAASWSVRTTGAAANPPRRPSAPSTAWKGANAASATTSSTAATRPGACLDPASPCRGSPSSALRSRLARLHAGRRPLIQEPLWNVGDRGWRACPARRPTSATGSSPTPLTS